MMNYKKLRLLLAILAHFLGGPLLMMQFDFWGPLTSPTG